MFPKSQIYVFIALFLAACQSNNPVKLIYPDKIYQYEEWTEDELNEGIVIRHLYRGTDASTHLVRLKGNEFPHYHDRHDLNVTVLSGKSIIHFKDHEVSLMPGDVIFIPKGTFHWAENTDPVASVVFVVFSPAFDGKDKRKAD
jgi:mannose-6-phosphate isomerase-like protein (cupin superfamily)